MEQNTHQLSSEPPSSLQHGDAQLPPAAARDLGSVADMVGLKAAGREMTEDQVTQLVTTIADGTMDQTQLGAFLMAVFIRGMSSEETVALTRAMKNSGGVLEWPKDWVVGDKHSTGGVGDKVSRPLTPALAACGLKVPMISGRGLGYTGGTLDKLESIPGFNACLSEQQLLAALQQVGCAITGQTSQLVPADRRMYAARDITGTVASQPLIVSSILSKKAAESLSSLVLDVKFGDGSVIQGLAEAEQLAQVLVDTMTAMGVTTTALLTNMDYPIGRTIGNALEVKEALQCMSGHGPNDLQQLVIALGGELLSSAGLFPSVEAGKVAIETSLKTGTALDTFRRMMLMQGVSEEVAEAVCCSAPSSPPVLPVAPHTTPLRSPAAGVIVQQRARALAEASIGLGSGRRRAGDTIAYDVGVVLQKVVGQPVQEGEVWATLHHREACVPPLLLQKASDALVVDPEGKAFVATSRVFKTVRSTL